MTVRFSASAAKQLMACPGSANLELAIPGWVPPVRDETTGRKGIGTMIHKLLEQAALLSARDMEALAVAMQFVAQLRRTRRFKVLVEETVTAEWLQTKPKTTPDLVLYTQDEMHIIDYKAGKIPVDAYENSQLLFLAPTLAHLAPKATEVHMHIVQPWADLTTGISTWVASATRIAQFMADAIKAEERILAKDLTLSPGDHCTFCPANPHSRGDKGRPLCPVQMQLLYPAQVDEQEIPDL